MSYNETTERGQAKLGYPWTDVFYQDYGENSITWRAGSVMRWNDQTQAHSKFGNVFFPQATLNLAIAQGRGFGFATSRDGTLSPVGIMIMPANLSGSDSSINEVKPFRGAYILKAGLWNNSCADGPCREHRVPLGESILTQFSEYLIQC
jgi:hypothetical protein